MPGSSPILPRPDGKLKTVDSHQSFDIFALQFVRITVLNPCLIREICVNKVSSFKFQAFSFCLVQFVCFMCFVVKQFLRLLRLLAAISAFPNFSVSAFQINPC